jgi:hypothetical protein
MPAGKDAISLAEMARVRVRFEMNRGRRGASLSKLAKIAEQLERFLIRVAHDCAIPAKGGEWLALNFENGSVSYDAEFQGETSADDAVAFHRAIDYVTAFDPQTTELNGVVSSRTMIEYAHIGSLIDPDESLGIGLYAPTDHDPSPPKWRQIAYSKFSDIRREVEVALSVHGAVQGIVHAWFKEAEQPYFRLRELSTWALVNCFYSPKLYPDVVRAVRERNTVLIVSGSVKYDHLSRAAKEIDVERIEPVETLSSDEFDRLFGSAPRFTGDQSTDEFMDWVRRDA